MCFIPHDFRNASNSALTNCFPLSETISSGNPNLANISFNALITSREVTSCIMNASEYDKQ